MQGFHFQDLSLVPLLRCIFLHFILAQSLRFDAWRLQVEYARRHGYDLYTIVNEKTHRTLNPARSSQLLMSGGTGCDYIFWVEKNAVILDMNFRLEGR